MSRLLVSEEFKDVTLVCDDGELIRAHRNILSICSPVLRNILLADRRNTPTIYLRGINHTEMEAIIKFIYLGQASVSKSRVDEFLLVADNLKIKELCQEPITKLVESDNNLEDTNEGNGVLKDITKETLVKYEEENILKMEVIEDTEVGEEKYVSDEQDKTHSGEFKIKERDIFIEGDIYGKEKIENAMEKIGGSTQSNDDEIDLKMEKDKKIKKKVLKNLETKTCEQCGKVFTKKKSLSYHKETVHSTIEYPCSKCEFKATRLDRLRIHIQSKHEGVKFSCSHCSKKFNFKNNCTAHIKSVHEGVKYECLHCDQKYTDRATLRKHTLKKHIK